MVSFSLGSEQAMAKPQGNPEWTGRLGGLNLDVNEVPFAWKVTGNVQQSLGMLHKSRFSDT
jgi:hypothetical protein